MVAIADGQHHGLLPLGGGPAVGERGRVSQFGKSRVDLRDERRILDGPAAQTAAAQHQLAVVERRKLVFHKADGLDERAVGVVGQHHDVGRFQRRTAAHFQPWRDALHDGALAGADGGLAALGVVVGVEVHRAHKALADRAVHLGALHIDVAMYFPCQHGAAVVVHCAADALQAGVLLRGAQVSLRQDDVQRAGPALGAGLGALPVLRLGGELVHGNAGPRVQRNAGGGQQDISGGKTGFGHDNDPLTNVDRPPLPGSGRAMPAPARNGHYKTTVWPTRA